MADNANEPEYLGTIDVQENTIRIFRALDDEVSPKSELAIQRYVLMRQ